VLLWQREALTVREIIEQLHLDYGTVSPLLKRLESRGLVKRRRRPDDERSVAITLTDDGRALKGQTAGFDDVLPRAFGLDQAQSIQFRQMLSRVRSQAASVAAELAAQTHTVHGPQT
jgi:DNA-binding MarR family transcriptional regulator